jgi:formamidopyrimidine-DNA glycosylase
MPELPEVENTLRYLKEKGLIGMTIDSIWTESPNNIVGLSPEQFSNTFYGITITTAERKAKYINISTETNTDYFSIHLGMTGGLRLDDTDVEMQKYCRHVIHLQERKELRFLDARKFGKIIYQHKPKTPLMLDPLDSNFSLNDLPAHVKIRRATIKSMIMDQSIIPGIGNLYADESLFKAEINPFRPICLMEAKDFLKLTESIKTVLKNALAQYDKNRELDDYQPDFNLSPWDIVRKENAECFQCWEPMFFGRINSRGTYYCNNCQPT